MGYELLGQPLSFTRGPEWKNRFALAPLTNQQSHDDGVMSEEEFTWLTMRAKGGFGMTMTCAAHVDAGGQGFPGQMAIYGDQHLEGLSRMAAQIRDYGSVSSVQLHHAGIRSPHDLVGQSVGPSDEAETGSRALSLDEVYAVRDAFIAGAKRAEAAGFDGVEVHGAHGYLLAQFLSAEFNQRDDQYGGSLENRARLLMEVVDGIRAACRPDFQLGVRLSPERFGMALPEVKNVATQLMTGGKIDYLDMSLWDAFKMPDDETCQDKSLLQHFADLPRGNARLTAAGKIRSAQDAVAIVEAGYDFVMIGRAAILHHDFPQLALADREFKSVKTPVSEDYLAAEYISPVFVEYLRAFRMVA